ncbi:MAG: hypothetical protein ABWZ62_13680 [Actinomycetota bacterium]|jgi:hypothetical protein
MGVLRTKSIEQSIRDTEESEHKFRKDLYGYRQSRLATQRESRPASRS